MQGAPQDGQTATSAPSRSSADVRRGLIEALCLDLVGPLASAGADTVDARYRTEVLTTAPSKWYLLGFLVPFDAPPAERHDPDEDEALDEVGAATPGDDDQTPEPATAHRSHFPSSLGLSVLVGADVRELEAEVAWGDYVPLARAPKADASAAASAADDPVSTASEPNGDHGERGRWRRVPRAAAVTLALAERDQRELKVALPGFPDIRVVASVRAIPDSVHVPRGTRSVSVFVVNARPHAPDVRRDAAYMFQPELTLRAAAGFCPRPDTHGHGSHDGDEAIADLQYRDTFEFAVGHNVSATAVRGADGICREVRSVWMPLAEVEKVVPRPLPEVTLGMEALGDAPSAEAARGMIAPMLVAYDVWLAEQAADAAQRIADGPRRATAEELLGRARRAAGRIRAGLAALDDPHILEAFRIANLAMARASRQRACHDRQDAAPEALPAPTWRPFQLAFVLMNLTGTADPTHADRRVVDLLFFPTGGGKTEAYLGLAAFAIVLRRLRDPSIQSAGVTVLMRYTLRLLTLDQLGRAATLMCALELMRQADVAKLGTWPFEVGLWVGQAATPNLMGRKGDKNEHTARARTIAFMNDSKRGSSPIPLETCPWCGWKFSKDSFKLLPNADEPRDLRVVCNNRKCEFHARREARGIPVLAVDEPIYRRLPAFLIATVDKFANLPWVGQTAGLFGRVERHDADGFYGPCDPGKGSPLARPLSPPALVIQDELHLISGPLGTMVGLYETAIDALSTAGAIGDAQAPRPKIVASTATVRRAERQIQALFGRSAVDIFPPPGPDRRDSFFAETVGRDVQNARAYIGIAAPGRNVKVVLLRTYLALMAAAQKAWKEQGGEKNPANPADPYMTLLGYFGSLRELGGARRIVEDEVTTRLVDFATRRRRVGETSGLFANRPRVHEPSELTSRVETAPLAETKRRLALAHSDKEHIDVALATNMISVGLDITRLGLMVVLGQPKTASEYIQATSRVGRDERRPGLVVTLLNVYRPRDRSHYERFEAWHASFYRAVEATSVTPFSPRAIDRGVAAVTVALARLGLPGMTAPRGALAVGQRRSELGFVADVLARRAECHDLQLGKDESEALRKKVRDRVVGLLDAWAGIAARRGDLQYQAEIGSAPPLLFTPLDPELAKQPAEARQFRANRSLREVEPAVNLWLRAPDGGALGSDDEGGIV